MNAISYSPGISRGICLQGSSGRGSTWRFTNKPCLAVCSRPVWVARSCSFISLPNVIRNLLGPNRRLGPGHLTTPTTNSAELTISRLNYLLEVKLSLGQLGPARRTCPCCRRQAAKPGQNPLDATARAPAWEACLLYLCSMERGAVSPRSFFQAESSMSRGHCAPMQLLLDEMHNEPCDSTP
jgi:hypothetical protein